MRYLQFDEKNWAARVSEELLLRMNSIKNFEFMSVGLTGGKTAGLIYSEIRKNKKFMKLKNINFYLTDERFASLKSEESNYRLIMSTLFLDGLPSECNFFYFDENDLNEDFPYSKYSSLFPKSFDLLILTVGNDGHIASIFNRDFYLESKPDMFFLTTPPQSGLKRISIAPSVMQAAKEILVLAPGDIKKNIFINVVNSDASNMIPASLVKRGLWFLSYSSCHGLHEGGDCN